MVARIGSQRLISKRCAIADTEMLYLKRRESMCLALRCRSACSAKLDLCHQGIKSDRVDCDMVQAPRARAHRNWRAHTGREV